VTTPENSNVTTGYKERVYEKDLLASDTYKKTETSFATSTNFVSKNR
jgi:hypothetical protein